MVKEINMTEFYIVVNIRVAIFSNNLCNCVSISTEYKVKQDLSKRNVSHSNKNKTKRDLYHATKLKIFFN